MPLTGSENNRFKEFGKGKTYKHTAEKFGKEKADKQRIAVVMKSEGKGMSKKKDSPKKDSPKKATGKAVAKKQKHGKK
jgi:hypothetical protein